MIGYLDTSAFVPLLIREPTSEACRRIWDDADVIVSSRLLYIETAAALAQAERMGRLTEGEHLQARRRLNQLWSEMDVIEVDEQVVTKAADLAYRLALRGYDAVHAASAEQLEDEDVVSASGDERLLAAWLELGMATYNTNQDPTPRTK
ncbi:type II toxin-antitoxin system VapC family toxin [Mycobacterium hubeiense]|uniref:type II toxin-antitoxin system VapC family toxin n=1 Tax=Mycobacterium hubeiense TaxID=1867256 RepID=UPI000C7ECBAE|nr:type II toxin-antitoxin system VapC family toxin [Mycobacterium sp. QGD 101]